MPRKSVPPKGAISASAEVTPVDDPVGAALRRLHEEVVSEPLPEDFLRLLGEIERKIAAEPDQE